MAEAELQERTLENKACRDYLVQVGKRLGLWTALPKEKLDWKLVSRKGAKQIEEKGGGPDWGYKAGVWSVTRCFKYSYTLAGRAKQAACTGGVGYLAELMQSQRGHRLYEFEGRTWSVLACGSCGAWSCTKPDKLMQYCKGRPTTAGQRDWNRLVAGVHPTSGEHVGTGRPCLPLLRAWSGS